MKKHKSSKETAPISMAPFGCTHDRYSTRLRSTIGTDVSRLEREFAHFWRKANTRDLTFDYGYVPLDHLTDARILRDPTDPRAKSVNATIQWLGTPCGLSFLNEMLKESGYRIRKIPEK